MPRTAGGSGPIAFMARNGVASNVLMLFLVLGGLAAATNLVQEVLPDLSLDRVQVLVAYPGATPGEIEESVVSKIEERIRGVEGLDRVEGTASEGFGSVVASFKSGTDIDRALSEVKAEIDRIATFPEEAERPQVREVTSRQNVIRLLVHGDVPERALKELAYEIEEGVSSLPEVSLAEVSGARPYEVSIEVPVSRLRALGLTLEEVALVVRQGSMELPAGRISTGEEEFLVRTLGRNYDQADFEEIVVLTRLDGTSVRLGEIATVRDGFADSDLSLRYNGQRAMAVDVFRSSNEKVLEIAEAVREHVAAEVLPSLPRGVGVTIWKDDSVEVSGRLGLMIENALLGLALVLLALTLFLELRLALWVAAGLAVSFIGTLLFMELLGLSVNMFSLMALVLALGIVVDDAIVVGESVFSERERGASGAAAAIRGTRRVSAPVIFAVLTTATAFAALLPAPGPQGALGRPIPMVVITILLVSLVESLLVLPSHLSHLPAPGAEGSGRLSGLLDRLRGRIDGLLRRFAQGPLDRALHLAVDRSAVVLASAAGLLVLAMATVGAGVVPSQFLTPIEGEVVSANLQMPVGTPRERTSAAAAELEAAGRRAVERISRERGIDGELEVGVAITVGRQAELFDPLGGNAEQAARGHLGAVQFRLIDWERHDIAPSAFERVWREEARPLPGASSLSISSNLITLGLPVHFELSHPDPVRLAAVEEEFVAELAGMDGVFDVRSNLDEGFQELQLELKPEARTLNLTIGGFASQVRSAFFGAEALRLQRGREDVGVHVRLPEEERNSPTDVERYPVRTPGGEVPLGQVASVGFAPSASTIHRMDGRRAVTVTADVDPAVATGQQVNRSLDELLERISAEDVRFEHDFGGQRRQQQEANEALGRSLFLALLVMYALMAIPFRSYAQPLIILAAVPLGLVGAVAGHMLLGLSMGIWSMYGLIGVSGVVVNDSLMLIKFVNDLKASGASAREAIVAGAKDRFRAILLTSVTTFAGVAPLVFETSTHAQHLVPLAASVGFGVLIATALLMVVIPALLAAQETARGWRRRAAA